MQHASPAANLPPQSRHTRLRETVVGDAVAVAVGCDRWLRDQHHEHVSNRGSRGHDCNNAANCSTLGGSTEACTPSACTVVGCSAGRFDIDRTCTDGCECAASGTSSVCAASTSLGTDWEPFVSGPTGYTNPNPAVPPVYIHVCRRAGLPVTCNSYTLTITN